MFVKSKSKGLLYCGICCVSFFLFNGGFLEVDFFVPALYALPANVDDL